MPNKLKQDVISVVKFDIKKKTVGKMKTIKTNIQKDGRKIIHQILKIKKTRKMKKMTSQINNIRIQILYADNVIKRGTFNPIAQEIIQVKKKG